MFLYRVSIALLPACILRRMHSCLVNVSASSHRVRPPPSNCTFAAHFPAHYRVCNKQLTSNRLAALAKKRKLPVKIWSTRKKAKKNSTSPSKKKLSATKSTRSIRATRTTR